MVNGHVGLTLKDPLRKRYVNSWNIGASAALNTRASALRLYDYQNFHHGFGGVGRSLGTLAGRHRRAGAR